jgi:hypothetical protein
MALDRLLLPADDLRHARGSHPFWDESFYFNFFDPTGRFGGWARLGYSNVRDFAEGLFAVHDAAGTLMFARLRAPWTEPEPSTRQLSIGPLRATCVEPLDTWELSYDGDVMVVEDTATCSLVTESGPWMLPRRRLEMALSFKSFHPPYLFPKLPQKLRPLGETLRGPARDGSFYQRLLDFPDRMAIAVAMHENGHFEQAGHWRGEVALDGEPFRFAGTGLRDRSWGVRDWRVFTRYRWINSQFGEELAFNAFRAHLVGFDAWGGYVWHGGKLMAMRDWSREENADGSATLTLHPEGGEVLRVGVKTVVPVPIRITQALHSIVFNEAMSKTTWRGLESRGVNEFVERSWP